MEKEELRNKILEVLKRNRLASLATIKDGKPWVRYMVMTNKGLELYATTFASSRKVKQIKANDNIHITIGGDPNNWKAPYLNIQAAAEVLTDIETKKEFWNDMLRQFFKGPDDPTYAVIRISPQLIEYTDAETHKTDVYEVK